MIEWDHNARKIADYAMRIREETPWLSENFFYQFSPWHTELIKQIYFYIIDHVAEEKFESKRHTYKNVYVIGSWYGLQLYDMFNEKRKDRFEEGTEVSFTFIDRNRDFIKAIEIMQEVWHDPNSKQKGYRKIKAIKADIVFENIDFSDADLVIMPYAEEIMPIQHLNLNITCPIIAAFTHHRYQRVRNRNFSEPIESINDIHMADLKRKYLQRLGPNEVDWVYTDIVTMDLTQD
jgi:hypothetical protein